MQQSEISHDTVDSSQKQPQGTHDVQVGEIMEGKVKIQVNNAFYNETQVFNRDFTIVALQAYLQRHYKANEKKSYWHTPTVLDALSATGLRALRYKKEILSQIVVTANDISERAVDQISNNLKANALEVQPNLADCNRLMHKQQFTVIDLDPYGAPTPFLAAAFDSIENNGLLMITATDSQITCGRQKDECLRRYQAVPVNQSFGHEESIRIVIKCVAEEANRHRCGFKVLASFFMFHYLRIFVQVDKKHSLGVEMLAKCKELGVCAGCGYVQEGSSIVDEQVCNMAAKCQYCNGNVKRMGPIWMGELWDNQFLVEMRELLQDGYSYLQQRDRIDKLLQFQLLEKQQFQLFFDISEVSKYFRCTTIPANILINFLQQLNVDCSPTYFCAQGIKIPFCNYFAVLQIFKLWFSIQLQANVVKAENSKDIVPNSVFLDNEEDLKWILETQCRTKAEDIDLVMAKCSEYVKQPGLKIDRRPQEIFKKCSDIGLFTKNPEKNWGPKKMK